MEQIKQIANILDFDQTSFKGIAGELERGNKTIF